MGTTTSHIIGKKRNYKLINYNFILLFVILEMDHFPTPENVLKVATIASELTALSRGKNQVVMEIVKGFSAIGNDTLLKTMEPGRKAIATAELGEFVSELTYDLDIDDAKRKVSGFLRDGADADTVLHMFLLQCGEYDARDTRDRVFDFVIELLVDHGASVDTDGDGITALMLACYWGAGDLARKLLHLGASVSIYRHSLVYAFYDKEELDVELIRLLIDKGAEVNCSMTTYPLHCAIALGNIEVVEMLLDAGADVDAWADDEDRNSALMIAIQDNAIDIAEMLLDAGVDFYQPSTYEGRQYTPLEAAREFDCDEIVELLVKAEKERGNDLMKRRIVDAYRSDCYLDLSVFEFASNKLFDNEKKLPQHILDAFECLPIFMEVLEILKHPLKTVKEQLGVLCKYGNVDFSKLKDFPGIDSERFVRGCEAWEKLLNIIQCVVFRS